VARTGESLLDSVAQLVGRRPPPDPGQVYGPAAVLVVIAPGSSAADDFDVLLIRRSATLKHHAGQFAFPGGRFEPDDVTLWNTALREAEEEVGITPSAVAPLGSLTPITIVATGFTVTPCVAVAKRRLPLRANAGEVADAFWVPLHTLAAVHHRVLRTRSNGAVGYWPEFRIAEGRVWGATAFMLDELLTGIGLVRAQASGSRESRA
jgi:8-oxo-dGTP pyrophosphatase MutT (NUDIX family)